MQLKQMNSIKAAIAGGTGYTAGELLRLLINHPNVEITSVISSSSAGEKVSSVHRDLIGETELRFSETLDSEPDVLFLCLGHGISRDFLKKNEISKRCKIIDLGNDFRIDNKYNERQFVYGLCELNHDEIAKADAIANPGCFATAIQLAILPLIKSKLIGDDIHITAITGSTGAGRTLSQTGHFSYRDSNISVYKPFTHQHLGEINQTVSLMTGESPQINFVPIRGDFTRGIFASIHTKCNKRVEEVMDLYKKEYIHSPFVHISEEAISLKEVVNTNKCLLHIELHNGYIHITSVIDNLIKGASGQAVQNMNIAFGLDECTALRLKPSAF